MRCPERTIMIQLKNENYKRLILELPNDFMNIEEEANRLTYLIGDYQ